MITPTVGRVVWVRGRYGSISGEQPEAALVAYVHSERCINVAGWNANGEPFAATSVHLKQADDEPLPGHCTMWAEWMPYQKGQAAKTEALERAARAEYSR